MDKFKQKDHFKIFKKEISFSNDLSIPIMLKICSLERLLEKSITYNQAELYNFSKVFEDSSLFKRQSNFFKNSELIVKLIICQKNNNHFFGTVQTKYKNFTNERIWNEILKIPAFYNQISIDSYLKIILYEFEDLKPRIFGIGFLSFFESFNSVLRSGLQKVRIFLNDEYKNMTTENFFEDQFEMDDLIFFSESNYVFKDLLNESNKKFVEIFKKKKFIYIAEEKINYNYYLNIEFPIFQFPVIFSSSDVVSSNFEKNKVLISSDTLNRKSQNVLVDLDLGKFKNDFSLNEFDLFSNSCLYINNDKLDMSFMDPIELKYQKLERKLSYNPILDKDLKPSPLIRDKIQKILNMPLNYNLNESEKNLIWRYRFFYSKNNISNSINEDIINRNTDSFLLKLLKSIDWENENELSHVFNELIPDYWSSNKLQISDALELLSNYFNPYVFGKSLLRSIDLLRNSKTNEQKFKNDLSRVYTMFKCIIFIRNFAVKRLELSRNNEILLYLLQLVQALKYESIIFDKFHDSNLVDDFKLLNNCSNNDFMIKRSLELFLINKSIHCQEIGNYFYWFLKTESEDSSSNYTKLYLNVLNKYTTQLKSYCELNNFEQYNNLKKQVWFIERLFDIFNLIQKNFKKNDNVLEKLSFLKNFLKCESNNLTNFPFSLPLPLDPFVIVCGFIPEDCFFFKSNLSPLKLTLKTLINETDQDPKYGKYSIIFKVGDDLRQDQFVIQIIQIVDHFLKDENLDFKLTPYKILTVNHKAGLIQFVSNETLNKILSNYYSCLNSENFLQIYNGESKNFDNGILNSLRSYSYDKCLEKKIKSKTCENAIQKKFKIHENNNDLNVDLDVMNNYIKSCAGYCVISYLLGIGDRHLENLLLSPDGRFWHADFGYILGNDPKPFSPLIKLPLQLIEGMGGLEHENYNLFKNHCFIAYMTIRKNINLLLGLFYLMLDSSIPDIRSDPQRGFEKFKEKFCVELNDEQAIIHFHNLINSSVNAFIPIIIDKLHSFAQYWRG